MLPFFLTFIIFTTHSHSTTHIHSSFAIRRGLSSCILIAREEPPWDAEPRIELGPALQQADALPTELRRILTELRRILTELRPILIELRRILIELRRILIELRHILTELRRIGCGPQIFGCLLRWLKPPLYLSYNNSSVSAFLTSLLFFLFCMSQI